MFLVFNFINDAAISHSQSTCLYAHFSQMMIRVLDEARVEGKTVTELEVLHSRLDAINKCASENESQRAEMQSDALFERVRQHFTGRTQKDTINITMYSSLLDRKFSQSLSKIEFDAFGNAGAFYSFFRNTCAALSATAMQSVLTTAPGFSDHGDLLTEWARTFRTHKV